MPGARGDFWDFGMQYNKAGEAFAGSEYNDKGEGMTAMFDDLMEFLAFAYGVIMLAVLPAWFFYWIFGGFR